MPGLPLLQRRLGVAFRNVALLELALTHRSVSGGHNNERLEFLGDAILGMVIADFLYVNFPKEKEGRLTRMRATLVRQETLAAVAREFQLGDFLRLGSGELKSGGYRRDSILSDALEAIIGALYLDAGDITVCRDAILRWFGERLRQIEEAPVLKDPKSRLQEHLQAGQRALPNYTVLAVSGADHDQHFCVRCEVEGVEPAEGEGVTRRYAEQAAAVIILQRLGLPT